MDLNLKKLEELYKNAKKRNKNLFIYDEVENIDFYSIHKDGFDINIKRMISKNTYKIFILIGKKNKILFNCPIAESTDNLKDLYNRLLEDINELTLDEVINKYYCDLITFL